MTIDFDNIQVVTDANLLKAVNVAIATVMVGGQSYTINGRTFTRGDLDKLYKIKNDLEQVVSEAASATGSTTALARFGGPA